MAFAWKDIPAQRHSWVRNGVNDLMISTVDFWKFLKNFQNVGDKFFTIPTQKGKRRAAYSNTVDFFEKKSLSGSQMIFHQLQCICFAPCCHLLHKQAYNVIAEYFGIVPGFIVISNLYIEIFPLMGLTKYSFEYSNSREIALSIWITVDSATTNVSSIGCL